MVFFFFAKGEGKVAALDGRTDDTQGNLVAGFAAHTRLLEVERSGRATERKESFGFC